MKVKESGMSTSTVPLTEKEIKKYLDTNIRQWRDKLKFGIKDAIFSSMCVCYIDAFQSVRISLFGESLD